MGYKLSEPFQKEIKDERDSESGDGKRDAKCKRAGGLMMKYMDGDISKQEISWLNKHVSECSECHDDFMLYDMIADGFADIEILPAPEGFEEQVMLKIESLLAEEKPLTAAKTAASLDNVIFAVWGVFSVLFGAGFLLFLNREQIIASMQSNTQTSAILALYLQIINPVLNLVNEFIVNLQLVFTNSINATAKFATDYRFVILGIFAVLVAAQYVVRARKTGIDIAFAEEKSEAKLTDMP